MGTGGGGVSFGFKLGYRPRHKPAGPGGGQFTHPERTEAGIAVGGLRVDKAAENKYPDQVASIREAGLKGSLDATDKGLLYSSEDGCAFDIHQDGHTTPDGSLGWAVDNHDQAEADDPAYGLRYETVTGALGETVAEAAFDSAAIEAFTLKEGEVFDFKTSAVYQRGGVTMVSASFYDAETADDLDVYYDVDRRALDVYYGDSQVTGGEADEVLRDLVDNAHLGAPGGSPSQQVSWHMERSLRILAAKDDSPEWIHPYRVAGLSWDDRH